MTDHVVNNAEELIRRIESVQLNNKLTVEKNLERQVDDIKKRIERRKINSRANSANGSEGFAEDR